MNNTRLNELDLAIQPEVITICDYGTRPTIESKKAINTIIVVKSDAKFQGIEARTNNINNGHYEPLENRTLGSLLQ